MVNFSISWTDKERKLLESLNHPRKIQDFLDEIEYNKNKECRSPRYVIKNKKANCSEGAIFAAACLQYHGYNPLIMDLRAEKGKDDDHVIAIFGGQGNLWGAIAKSNYSGLRFREAIHRSSRELAVSYFNDYFNSDGEKTLKEFSMFLNIESIFGQRNWQTTDEEVDFITEHLDDLEHESILPKRAKNIKFSLTDKRSLEAGLYGSNPDGLFKIKE